MSTFTRNSWEDQKPELTAENADEIVQMINDIVTIIECGNAEVGCDSVYRPGWDGMSIPNLLSFSLKNVGIEVQIGRDRGGSWIHLDDAGERENGIYHSSVDIKISIPLKLSFQPLGYLVNLWFDGTKGEHEERVLEAVIRLRTAYLQYLVWYFTQGDIEVPILIEVAKKRLSMEAECARSLFGKRQDLA